MYSVLWHGFINAVLGGICVNSAMEIVQNALSRDSWISKSTGLRVWMQQSWAYGVTLAALGCTVHRLEVFYKGHSVGLAQVLERPMTRWGNVHMLNAGPVWLADLTVSQKREALRAIRQHLRCTKRSIFVATLNDAIPGLFPVYTPTTQSWVSLGEHDAMRARMHGKWRNGLVKAESTGLVVQRSRDPGAFRF